MNFRQQAITFISAGAPFGFFMAVIFSFQFGQPWGVVAGVVSGVLFGSVIALFVLYSYPWGAIRIERVDCAKSMADLSGSLAAISCSPFSATLAFARSD